MGLAAFEWQMKQDWNCKILISLRIQFPHISYRHLSPMIQTLGTLSSQYKSVKSTFSASSKTFRGSIL